MNMFLERFLVLLTLSVKSAHEAKSTATKNRYQLSDDVYVWFNQGKITHLHQTGSDVTLNFETNQKEPLSLGVKGFYVDIRNRFINELATSYKTSTTAATEIFNEMIGELLCQK